MTNSTRKIKVKRAESIPVGEGERACWYCLVAKPIEEFRKHGKSADGLSRKCEDCHTHKPRKGDWRNGSDPKYPVIHSVAKAPPEVRREARLLEKYGMLPGDYDRWMEAQNYQCPICEISVEESEKVFHVDHDHITLDIRGILCNTCNVGLGFFKDDPERLRAAARYLENFFNANAIK